jgi:23S rRNA (cytosine1962-C5)-methyltransferase
MRTLKLKPGRAKPAWLGHPWIFADSVASLDPEAPSDAGAPANDWVQVLDADGKVVGCGFLSPDSAIQVRLMHRGADPADADALLAVRLEAAAALRERLFPDPAQTNAYRLVHADGDGIPGLVVDRLGEVLVAQFAIAATHARREHIAKFLLERTGAATLVSRLAGFEEVEGIDADDSYLLGKAPPESVAIIEEGMLLEAAPLHGQKTGHYVDQRENRRLVGEIAGGLSVLDLYAGTGGFSLQCLRHGAKRAVAVDTSARSMDAAHRNADRNGVAAGFEGHADDASKFLAALRVEKTQFDLVVADPPNFFPRKGNDRGALKAHRELNVRALSRVRPGGFLATFTCSARLDPVQFLEMLRSASRECRRGFRVLRELGAGPDHPVAAGLPAGRYLAGFLLQVDA